MTLDEIKADIVAACREFRERGYRLSAGAFDFRDSSLRVCGGCAITAVGVSRCNLVLDPSSGIDTETLFDAVRKRYGLDDDDMIVSLIRGFDGERFRGFCRDSFDVGRAVRAEVLP